MGSAAAGKEGSRNLIGIKDAGIDALIDRVIFAKDRPTVLAATHAWTGCSSPTITWCRNGLPTSRGPSGGTGFAHPKVLPTYGSSGFPTTWWYDEALAAKTGAPR